MMVMALTVVKKLKLTNGGGGMGLRGGNRI